MVKGDDNNSEGNFTTNDNERNYIIHLTCSKETAKLIMKDCVNLFLNSHPEFKGIKISQGFILRKIVDFYLKD